MAATDQFYRSQKTLDIVFGVSCILMLLTAVWMFAQDFNREFKTEAREFRNVEEAMNERSMLEKMPTVATMDEKRRDLKFARMDLDAAKKQLTADDARLIAQKDKDDTEFRSIKAEYDSKASYYNIAIEHFGRAESDSAKNRLAAEVEERKEELERLEKELTAAQSKLDATNKQMRELRNREITIERPSGESDAKKTVTKTLAQFEDEVTFREDELKKVTGTFDRYAKLASKGWKSGDTFRSLPILDAFATPTPIKQVWLPDLTIDYSFKDVPRFDRCVSCHLGIDRANFDKKTLASLSSVEDAGALGKKLQEAELELRKRQASGEKLGFDPDDLPRKRRGPVWLPTIYLLLSTIMIALIIGGLEKSFRVGMAITISGVLITVIWGVFLALAAPQDPTVEVVPLTKAQETEFSAHPRLDLFVDANSTHPMEKFGCTICHSGQGSATDFILASHTPTNVAVADEWRREHGWAPNHYWDYPMLASRFVESSCLKCHHQVTDLIRYGSKDEAPKVVRGYNLVRELGCFGCHEISGLKSGRAVGPDLRLEPTPALDYMTSAEQEKARSDPLNPPGTFRKVGPSLRRIAEKTNQKWAKQWIFSPRGFRPDTRMPHFYNLGTNNPEQLPEDQKKFPDIEINSIAWYLFAESKAGLEGKDTTREAFEQRQRELQAVLVKVPLPERDWKDLQDASRRLVDIALLSSPFKAQEINRLAAEQKRLQGRLQELLHKQTDPRAEMSPAETGELALAQKELPDVTTRLIQEGQLVPLGKQLVDERGAEVALPAAGKADNGRRLFTEKGCLACHVHSGTEKAGPVPSVSNEAEFGPNLSRLAAKIAPEVGGDDAKRRWVIQWVMNPNVYHPRTRMPITHLTPSDAADIAEWLLTQPADWNGPEVGQPSMDDYVAYTRKYLEMQGKSVGITKADVDEFLPAQGERKGISAERLAALRKLSPDADELRLTAPITEEKLRWYIGRKVVSRGGCFACHDIPGFEPAKPIGTALNDWGKKDPERLAFEDADIYVRNTYNLVEIRYDPNHPHHPADDWKVGKDGKRPFEQLFYEALEHGHRNREGFLHLKLMDPRSYDYHRRMPWWDRLRMPQFRFARATRRLETPEAWEARLKELGLEKTSIDPRAARAPEKLEVYEARMRKEAEGIYDAQAEFDEAAAREAVMTFILGLTAEGSPAKYLPHPNTDRLAEIKGRQVLDKYNCAGCHQIRPGVLDFKLTPESLDSMKAAHEKYQKIDAKTDFFVPNHNAWEGPAPTSSDRMMAFFGSLRTGRNEDTNADEHIIRLSEALRFTGADGVQRDVPSMMEVAVQSKDVLSQAPSFGGTFANLMVETYLPKKNAELFKLDRGDNNQARSIVPPPLIREGERVQPNWLYGFLLNPEPVRPTSFMLLRMPKFNMSGEEARGIVDYFTAASRLGNPGAGVSSQYLSVSQQDAGFWRNANAEYLARLKKAGKFDSRLKEMNAVWQAYAERKVAELKVGLEALEQAVKDAKDDDPRKKDLAKRKAEIENWNRQIADKKFPDLQKSWETEDAYPTDAVRLLSNRELCLKCHNIGTMKTDEEKGPNLALTAGRLRPEWTEHWIASPKRLFPYDPIMPQNFPKDAKPVDYPEVVGSPYDKVRAVRDALMDLPRLTNLPVAQTPAPVPAGGGK
jgi:cbb3-type cytochrome oxidase cytochrome c subunit